MTFANIAIYTIASIATASVAALGLPRHISVERSTTLHADPKVVLALAASNQGYQTFNPYLTQDPDLVIETFGPKTGIGSGFHFEGKDGKGTQTVAKVTDSSVTYSIDLGALGKPTQSIHATAMGDGTHVIWQMQNDLGFNPIFRIVGLFADRMMGPTFEQGLENLGHVAA